MESAGGTTDFNSQKEKMLKALLSFPSTSSHSHSALSLSYSLPFLYRNNLSGTGCLILQMQIRCLFPATVVCKRTLFTMSRCPLQWSACGTKSIAVLPASARRLRRKKIARWHTTPLYLSFFETTDAFFFRVRHTGKKNDRNNFLACPFF